MLMLFGIVRQISQVTTDYKVIISGVKLSLLLPTSDLDRNLLKLFFPRDPRNEDTQPLRHLLQQLKNEFIIVAMTTSNVSIATKPSFL